MHDKNTFKKIAKSKKRVFICKKRVKILAKGFNGEMAIACGFLAMRNPYMNISRLHHI